MKQITPEETDFLFEWIKNWYPTQAKPKIVILLLNKHEWRQLYEKTRWITHEEFIKRINETLEEIGKEPRQSGLKSEFIKAFREINSLPQDARKELMNKLYPHFIVEEAAKIDYWMNEVSGECFLTDEIKLFAETMKIEIEDFYKPYLNYDFIIIISAFFNEEQKKICDTEKKRKVIIYNNIFHELIHVVEYCNQVPIFKTNNVEDNNKITLPIAFKYFQ